ncbi:MAG: hypothetical protein Q7W02_10775 [Candidatus Rokubacteria bacterium]|nr:hypothetical protein [Candidatus Rokubacteria bacterium]
MSVSPMGHVVIGVKHVCKELREDGLVPRGVPYASEVADVIRHRGGKRAARWYMKGLADMAKMKRTGKTPKRLKLGRIRVQVGNELVDIPLDRETLARILKSS